MFFLYPTNAIEGALNEGIKTPCEKVERETERVKRDILKWKEEKWEHFRTPKMKYGNYKMGRREYHFRDVSCHFLYICFMSIINKTLSCRYY